MDVMLTNAREMGNLIPAPTDGGVTVWINDTGRFLEYPVVLGLSPVCTVHVENERWL